MNSTHTAKVDRSLCGRLDPAKFWNQPVGDPLYPPLPWHSRESEHLVAIYETDIDPLLDVLPYDLTPTHNPPRVIIWHGSYGFCTGGGPYAETAALVPVTYEGRTFNYPIVVYLANETEEWFAAGREVWGHAKKIGHVFTEKVEGHGLVRGWLERPKGTKLIEITVGPFERVADPTEFEFIPVISVRIIPHPEKPEPEAAQLLETATQAEVRHGSDGVPMLWAGPATVSIARSEQDPLYKLPVRRVIGGYLAGFNFVTPYARILKSYV